VHHPTTAQLVISVVIAAVAGELVWFHADRHGSRHPMAWGLSVFFFLGVALPVYAIRYYRRRRRRRGNV
jgi:hypothetical protein